MPFFDYVCTECNHAFEAMQKVNAQDLEECPACHKAALKKKIGASAFRLKGSGWYESDFKKSDQKNISRSDSEA